MPPYPFFLRLFVLPRQIDRGGNKVVIFEKYVLASQDRIKIHLIAKDLI